MTDSLLKRNIGKAMEFENCFIFIFTRFFKMDEYYMTVFTVQF